LEAGDLEVIEKDQIVQYHELHPYTLTWGEGSVRQDYC